MDRVLLGSNHFPELLFPEHDRAGFPTGPFFCPLPPRDDLPACCKRPSG
jgi:hypothetical protein